MRHGLLVRLGGARLAVSPGSLIDAAEVLEAIARANLRAFLDDARLRDEAVRRVLSPPCPSRCYVQAGGANDCNCASGMQWSSDEEAQELEKCPPRDVWSDFRSLLMGHAAAGRGDSDPIVCDCDDMAPSAISVLAYLSWFAPSGYSVAGVPRTAPSVYRALGVGVRLGAARVGIARDDGARFAIAITHPPRADIAHAYALMNRRPPAPQPEIRSGDWYVWDPAAHWGMDRPAESFYFSAPPVAFELRREGLQGLSLSR